MKNTHESSQDYVRVLDREDDDYVKVLTYADDAMTGSVEKKDHLVFRYTIHHELIYVYI